jgi:hypothetical protein
MDDPLVVRAGEADRDRARDAHRFRGFERSPPDPRTERPPLDHLHREKEPPARIPHFVNSDEVRVIDRRGRTHLPEEATTTLRIPRDGSRKDLERDVARQARVLGAIHDPHAAAAQDGGDPTVTNHGAEERIPRSGGLP